MEFAFLAAPLCILLFGIIVYGYLMSFRQNMTQAAAEGARAGAVAVPNAPTYSIAIANATTATNNALGSFGQRCGSGGMTCNVNVYSAGSPQCNSTVACITVEVVYNYSANPLLPDVPLVSSVLPSQFRSSSTAQLNT